MEFDAKILQSFKELGIRGNKAKAYLTLLKIGPSTATRMSRFSGIPQPRTYDILNHLQQNGFVQIQRVGGRNLYKALEPGYALKQLMNTYDKKAEFIIEKIEKIEKIDEFFSPEIWMISNKENIISRFCDIINKSKIELLIAVPENFLMDQLISSILDASKRGVSISLILYSVYSSSELINEFRDHARVCLRKKSPPSMVTGDYKYALFLSHFKENKANLEHAIYTEDLGLMHILNWHFHNCLWITSNLILENQIKSRNFYHIWTSIEVINFHMKNSKKVYVKINGKNTKTQEDIHIEGNVVKTISKHPAPERIPQYSIIINKDGKDVLIGGRGAVIEDFQAYKINLKIIE